MTTFSTRQVARRLGITHVTLIKYISDKKISAPKSVTSGGMTIHLWTEEDIERLRKLLPKIANGRKTRYQKLRDKQKTPAGVPVPHKKRKPTKKK